jgi:hypothetical protein
MMTQFAMLETTTRSVEVDLRRGASSKKFRYSSAPRVPRRDAGFPLQDATAST